MRSPLPRLHAVRNLHAMRAPTRPLAFAEAPAQTAQGA